MDPSGLGSDEENLLITHHCSVSGSGTVGSDAFDGDMHDDTIGSWSHDGSAGLFEGTPVDLECRINGSTIADVMGTGTLDGVPGYTFSLHVQDRGDPSMPERLPGAPETTTVVASRTYCPSRWTDGTIEFDAGALVAVPASIPVTVGNAGNQWTHLTFVDHDTGDAIRCMYRGGASRPNPSSPSDVARGLRYDLARCEHMVCDEGSSRGRGRCRHCDWERMTDVVAGTVLDVDSIELHVQSGSNRHPTRSDARTEVSLALEVTPFSYRAPEPDSYRLVVFDPSDAVVMTVDGDLTSGDVSVVRLP